MKFSHRLITGVLILCLASSLACRREAAEGQATVEIVNGVEFVHNPAAPAHPDRTVSFEEELSIEPEDENGNVLLYRPGRFAVDERGTIYICDYQDKAVKAFAPDGHLLKTIGREGSGPGEFQNVGEIALLPDGGLVILDWELNRISIFDKDGGFVSSHKYQNNSYSLYFTTPTYYTREEIVYGDVIEPPLLERHLFIKAYDFAGRELFSFGEFVHYHSLIIDDGGRKSLISPKPFDVYSIFAFDAQNFRLYHCLNDAYQIEVLDIDGNLIRKIDRPYKKLPVTGTDRQEYLDEFGDSSERFLAVLDKTLEMPAEKTITDRMVVDDEGNLWVQTQEMETRNGACYVAYDIFDQAGYYVYKVWSAVRAGLFKNGKMYQMIKDEETGYRTFKRYSVIWTD